MAKKRISKRKTRLPKSLIGKVLEGDKQLREGTSLLTHDEVFGVKEPCVGK